MTIWFLAFLALVWCGVILPGAVRARRRTPLPAATRFKRVMGSIAPARPAPRHAVGRSTPRSIRNGRWVIVPHSSERAQQRVSAARSRQRRRRLLGVLAGAALCSAGMAVWRRGSWVEIHLMIDAMLLFYVALLLEAARRQAERHSKVRTLPHPTTTDVRSLDRVAADGGRGS